MITRLGRDPWAEAARSATLPRVGAIEDLAQSIAQMPLVPLCPGRDPHHSRILTAQAVTLTRLRRASSLRSVGVPIALLSSMTTMAIPALAVIGPETFGPGKATCERLGASQFDCLLTSLRVSDNGNDMATFGLATRRRRNGPSSKNGVPLPRRITPCKAMEPGRFLRLLICRP